MRKDQHVIRRAQQSANAHEHAAVHEADECAHKKFENHCHALALYFFFYNWVKLHATLRVSPAMAAGLSDKLMNWEDLLRIIDDENA